jgi:hypothetical protein
VTGPIILICQRPLYFKKNLTATRSLFFCKTLKFSGNKIAGKVISFYMLVQFFCVSQCEILYRDSGYFLRLLISEKIKHISEAQIISPLPEMEFYNRTVPLPPFVKMKPV